MPRDAEFDKLLYGDKGPPKATAPPATPEATKPTAEGGPILQDAPSRAVGGAIQGAVLDPIEGIGQAVEHYTGKHIPIPQSVRDYFSRVQDEVHSSGLGRAGEITGAVGSAFIAPEAAIGWLGRGAKAYEAARAAEELSAARTARTVGGAAFNPRTGAVTLGAGMPRAMEAGELAQASKGASNVRQSAKASEAIPRWKAAEAEAGRPLTEAERAEVTVGGKGPGPPPPPPSSGLGGRIARGTLGGAASAAAQPVQGGDDEFTQRKGEQALAGGLTGGLAGGLARVPLSEIVHALHHRPFQSIGHVAWPAVALHALGLGHYALPAGLAGLVAALLGRAGPAATRGAAAAEGQVVGD